MTLQPEGEQEEPQHYKVRAPSSAGTSRSLSQGNRDSFCLMAAPEMGSELSETRVHESDPFALKGKGGMTET